MSTPRPNGAYAEITDTEIELRDVISILSTKPAKMGFPVASETGTMIQELEVVQPLPVEGGIPFKVDAIDLPFIYVSFVTRPVAGSTQPTSYILDTRRYAFKLVADDFLTEYKKANERLVRNKEKALREMKAEGPQSLRELLIGGGKPVRTPRALPPPLSGEFPNTGSNGDGHDPHTPPPLPMM